MNVTNNLKLPQYTEEDIFDLQDINKAYNSIDNAYKEVIDFKNEIPKTNATAEVISARGGKETLGKRLDEFDSQLDTNTNTLNDLVVNLKDYEHLKEGNDWTNAFEQLAIDVNSKKSKKVLIPKGNYTISRPIYFVNIPGLTISGNNIWDTRLTPSSTFPADKAIINVLPANVKGASVVGVTIENIWFNMEGSECNGIYMCSCNDNIIFRNLNFNYPSGSSIVLNTKDDSTPLAYNFIEGVLFDSMTIIGVDKSIRTSTNPLILVKGLSGGGANEIYFRNCKFYMNPSYHDTSKLNSREAIRAEIYSHGWEISSCSFVSTINTSAITLSALGISTGHRIYSNMFENIRGTNGNCITLKSDNSGSNASQNFIGFNRFEYPVDVDYKYKLQCSYTTVFEPNVKVSEISVADPYFLNNLMCFGGGAKDDKLYKNALFSARGDGYDISSSLRVVNRGDSDSKDVKNLHPSIELGYLNELDYINRLTITDENYYYDSYENSLVVFKSAGKTPMFFNKGHFCIQRLDQSPTLQTEGAMYFNRVTKKFMGYNGTNWIELG